MKRAWIDYRTVKAAVSMEMALANYGGHLLRLDRTYLRGRCPLPTHHSTSSRQSFIVNTDNNAWACHSDSCVAARGGRLGGNVLDFVAAMEDCSIRDAALKLQDWFAVMTPPSLPTGPTSGPTESDAGRPLQDGANKPLPFALSWINCSHPYLSERGVDPDTAHHFGIGYNHGKGSMAGRIVIPIHDEDGFLVAYAGRSVDQTEPKYLFPARFRKSLVLFNLHRAAARGKEGIVVEGFFDCVRVHQAGLQSVVATMGCSLSRQQEELLKRYFRSVILLLDGDTAGRKASEVIAGRLVKSFSVRIVELPNGGQPDQLCADQIRCLCIPGYF